MPIPYGLIMSLKSWQKKENLTLIDLHDEFLDANNRPDPKYTEEGLHLNNKKLRYGQIF